MSQNIPQRVLAANVEIFRRSLAEETFGNVSGIDAATGQVFIKPSGMAYGEIAEIGRASCRERVYGRV